MEKVLIVEDEFAISQVLKAYLQDLTVSKKAIQSQLDTLATQYGSEEALESALASSNMTMNDDSSSVSNSTSS